MLPTLRQVLAMPSFKAAAIEVLAGDVDTAVVRWSIRPRCTRWVGCCPEMRSF